MSNKQNQISDSIVETNLFQSVAAGVIMLSFAFTGYVYITMEKNAIESGKNLASKSITNMIPEKEMLQLIPHTEESLVQVTTDNLESSDLENSDWLEKQIPAEVVVSVSAPAEISPVEPETQNNELLVFDVDCKLGQVHLFWVTSGDRQDYLVLEQSRDKKKFETINEQPLVQTRDGKNIYNLELMQPELGDIYFRLKNTGSNKNVEYSEIVSTSCKGLDLNIPEIDVFPTGRVTFKIMVKTEIDDHFTVSLTDLNEIELLAEDFEVSKGANEYTFKPGTIPHGIYSLKVSNGEITKEKRVTIK